jgi:solute carrier family 4 anion exchanger 2/solute carrier family 4 anion exchanger 3
MCVSTFTFVFKVFIELLQLDSSGLFWKEKARWIKYEENIEPSGSWGRPFLSYIDCESLRQLRGCVEQGKVFIRLISFSLIPFLFIIP